jgi:hypothetical protein
MYVTNYIGQSHSWHADSSTASQEISRDVWKFIAVVTTARHLSLSWVRPIQSTPPTLFLKQPF